MFVFGGWFHFRRVAYLALGRGRGRGCGRLLLGRALREGTGLREGGTIESALDARLGRDRVYGRFEGGNERWNRLGIDKGMSGAAVERT